MGFCLRFSIDTALALAFLMIIALFSLPAASPRALLAEGKGSPSPTPNPSPVTIEKARTSTPSSKGQPLAPTGGPSPVSGKDNRTKEGGSPSRSDEPSGTSKEGGVGQVSPPASDKGTGGKEHGEESPKSTNDDGPKEVCDPSLVNCRIDKLVACVKDIVYVSNTLAILLQNTGGSDLNITIKGKPGLNLDNQIVPGGHSKKVNISFMDMNNNEIALDAGNGDCNLHLAPRVSDGNSFPQIPTPTPMHGVYFLAFIVIIAGGTWACCKFGNREKRHDSGAQYQQLEMGIQPQSGSVIEESRTADGWDENWDDDWDEEEAAAKFPDKQSDTSVPTNGVPSKAPNKDGWDDDWED